MAPYGSVAHITQFISVYKYIINNKLKIIDFYFVFLYINYIKIEKLLLKDMKLELEKLIKQTILFKYTLPNKNIESTIYTNNMYYYPDCCYYVNYDENFIKILYNLIIYYSFTEQELSTENNLDNLLIKALEYRLNYKSDDNEEQKLKYGFYGEVLLYGILKVFFASNALISRGYLYSLGRETTGFDSFHIIRYDKKIELWFGEVKFYIDYKKALDSVFKSLEKDLSNNYLSKNIGVIFDKSHNGLFFNEPDENNKVFYNIIEKWKDDVSINLVKELNDNNMELIYPILLIIENNKEYDNTIDNIIKYINKKQVNIKINIKYSLFFIILPVNDVKLIKDRVLKCIEMKEKLI